MRVTPIAPGSKVTRSVTAVSAAGEAAGEGDGDGDASCGTPDRDGICVGLGDGRLAGGWRVPGAGGIVGSRLAGGIGAG